MNSKYDAGDFSFTFVVKDRDPQLLTIGYNINIKHPAGTAREIAEACYAEELDYAKCFELKNHYAIEHFRSKEDEIQYLESEFVERYEKKKRAAEEKAARQLRNQQFLAIQKTPRPGYHFCWECGREFKIGTGDARTALAANVNTVWGNLTSHHK